MESMYGVHNGYMHELHVSTPYFDCFGVIPGKMASPILRGMSCLRECSMHGRLVDNGTVRIVRILSDPECLPIVGQENVST